VPVGQADAEKAARIYDLLREGGVPFGALTTLVVAAARVIIGFPDDGTRHDIVEQFAEQLREEIADQEREMPPGKPH